MPKDNGRDDNGRFKKGHQQPGPGRPTRAVERHYLRVMVEVVSVDDWQAICERARDDALDGDASALKFLANWLMPAPPKDAPMSLTGMHADDQQHADNQTDAVEVELERRRKHDERWSLLLD